MDLIASHQGQPEKLVPDEGSPYAMAKADQEARGDKYENKVVMVASMNYLTFTPMVQCLTLALQRLKCPFFYSSSGPFWDRDFELALMTGLGSDPKYIVTIDHDSLFTAEDVARLIKIMDERPDIDALFPVQMSRHNHRPLCFNDAGGYAEDVSEQECGHFGLTVLRSSVLRFLPQPWFWSIPGPAGWADPKRSDADITFWRMLKRCGFKAAQANSVVIGHMLLAAKWPTDKGVALEPLPDFEQRGFQKAEWVKFNPEVFREAAPPENPVTCGPAAEPAD